MVTRTTIVNDKDTAAVDFLDSLIGEVAVLIQESLFEGAKVLD